ncbi:MAG: AraC family transcriptional regulator [Paludibacteraceae bacterium]|nr:AraC family transcriptional regulator [Paludibacteraceae bacterium]
MTLSTDSIFLTNDVEGFRECREKRTTSKDTMSAILCKKGYIDVYYHEEMIRINKGDLFFRIPDFAHELGPYEMSPDFEFSQVTVSAAIFEKVMYEHMRVEPNWYAKQEFLKEHPIFHVNAVSQDFFNTYFHLLALQLQDNLTEYRVQILQNIARAATMEMLNYIDKLSVLSPMELSRLSVNQSDYTFHEFTRLLQEYPHEREVQWYAKKLNITPKYLSEICKERSNKSASQWIADITVTEIKHLLRETTLPIREIARKMEFPNASFFCQYTKKHTGLTPNHFRKQKQA